MFEGYIMNVSFKVQIAILIFGVGTTDSGLVQAWVGVLAGRFAAFFSFSFSAFLRDFSLWLDRLSSDVASDT